MTHYVLMNMLKVLSHYGRVDWPKRAPGFIAQCLDIASNPETCVMGVTLLKIVSEEWTSTKGRITSSRRAKLRTMLTQEVPNIVNVFTSILTAMWSQNVQETGSSANQALDPEANYQSNFDNNNEAAELVKCVFEALQSFIHWAPLNIVLTPDHIDMLFRYSMLNDVTSSLALDCLNEMLERKYLPAEMRPFLQQLHGASMVVLSKVVKDETTLANLDPDYVAKWTQYINCFVQYHLERAATDIPLADFLALFAKYTFYQPSPQSFLDCLDIWEVILTLLENLKEDGLSVDAFGEVVCDFALSLMRSLLFRYNADQLEKLDGAVTADETTFTDHEEFSELDEHLNSALTSIELAYGLFPEPLQASLMAKILEPMGDFFNIHTILVANVGAEGGNGITFNAQLTAEQQREVYWAFRDVSTMVRATALIGSRFLQYFDATFNDAIALVNTLVELSSYLLTHQLHKYNAAGARLTGEVFGATRTFSEWFGLFWSQLQESGQANDALASLAATGSAGPEGSPPAIFTSAITTAFNCDLLALNSRSVAGNGEAVNIVELVPLSAAWHIRFTAAYTKSPVLHPLHFPAIAQFMNDVQAMAPYHTSDVQQNIGIALVLMHLVPWHATPAAGQLWNERAQIFAPYFESIAMPFTEAANAILHKGDVPYAPHIKEALDKALVVLTGIVRESAGKLDKAGLSILWQSLQSNIVLSLGLIEHYLDDLPILFRLLQLHIEVFSVLAPLVPNDLATNMLHTITSHLSGGTRLETLLTDAGGFGTAVAQRLLCLLKALVSRPNAPFLAEAFSFCAEKIYPSVQEGTTAPDVEQSFYEIMIELVLNHYRFLSQAPDAYNMVIESFLRVFQGQDIDIFKLVAMSLSEANKKYRIFSQSIFWDAGFSSYLATLFHVMIHRTHESLHDAILQLVYDIIEGAGFTPFFEEFLPPFLQDSLFHEITPEQKGALIKKLGAPNDLPTLTKGLADLMQDLGFLSGILRADP